MMHLGSIRDYIDRYDDLSLQMETLLQTHIQAELQSPNGHLKCRAIWLYGEFAPNIKSTEHLKLILELTYQSIQSEELPLQVMSATTMNKLLDKKEAKELVQPFLGALLERYLKLINETENEEIVSSLEDIVGIYKEDISPYAVDLVTNLIKQFERLQKIDQ